jgi:hypothetical protein
MHSTASDGILSPDAVVSAAAQKGLIAIALTDHDSTAGIPDAAVAAKQANILLVTGVELSAREGERETHILGLHIGSPQLLEARLRELRHARLERAELIVKKLQALGVPLTPDAVLLQAGSSAVGRPHVARAMVVAGLVPDVRSAFDRYLGAGRPAYVAKQEFTLSAAIELIHIAGGLAVLAHPGADGTVDALRAMRELGLDGVEVLHPSHSSEDVARLAAIVEYLGLVPSGGSDWHGVDAGRRKLAGQDVPFEWYEMQLERVDALRARAV